MGGRESGGGIPRGCGLGPVHAKVDVMGRSDGTGTSTGQVYEQIAQPSYGKQTVKFEQKDLESAAEVSKTQLKIPTKAERLAKSMGQLVKENGKSLTKADGTLKNGM